MKHSKEFYKSVIRVVDYIRSGNQDVTLGKGEELAGSYWFAVAELLAELRVASFFRSGDLSVRNRERLPSLYEDCRYTLLSREKEEEAWKTDQRYKIKGILYGRISMIMSGLSILLSLWVTLKQTGIF